MLQATFKGLISTVQITMQSTLGACRMQTGVRVARLQTLQQHSLRPSHIVRSSLAAPLLQRGLAGTARPASATHPASPEAIANEEVAGQDIAEIRSRPWNPLIANAISLVGNVGVDVELKFLESGSVVGKTRLAMNEKAKRNGEAPTSWYEVEMWGSLAEEAAQKVRKGSRICVQGQIKQDHWVARTGEKRSKIVVSAQAISFIDDTPYSGEGQYEHLPTAGQGPPQRSSSSGGNSQQQAAVQPPQHSGPAVKPTSSSPVEDKWRYLLENPHQFWDNRAGKRNPRAPDFKMKGTEEDVPLWISGRDTPRWVLDELVNKGMGPVQPTDPGMN